MANADEAKCGAASTVTPVTGSFPGSAPRTFISEVDDKGVPFSLLRP
jgi:hypothetical protein